MNWLLELIGWTLGAAFIGAAAIVGLGTAIDLLVWP